MKKRTILVLENIEKESTERLEMIQEIDDLFLSWFNPKKFYGREGVEVQMIKGFEETCMILKKNNVVVDAKKLTTLSYFQALEVVRKINKPK